MKVYLLKKKIIIFLHLFWMLRLKSMPTMALFSLIFMMVKKFRLARQTAAYPYLMSM